MTAIDIHQVLGHRYRTSQEAERLTDELRKNLVLDTKAQVVRLALGRSLAQGPLPEATFDAKGLDIPATSLFTKENIGVWVGLFSTHAVVHNGPPMDSMDALRVAIRSHWHRGVLALWQDWEECEGDYDKFIGTLIGRRSDMPENAPKHSSVDDEGGEAVPRGQPEDLSGAITKGLAELGIKVQVKDSTEGPRTTRYRVLLLNLGDSSKLQKNAAQLGLALNLGSKVPTISNGDEAKTLFVDVPRPLSDWNRISAERLFDWVSRQTRAVSQLQVYAGVTVTGEDFSFDLAAAPHLLVAGTTNSGKSVLLHSLILSLLLRNKPDELQLALIDPKRVEFSAYAKIPYLYGRAIATEVQPAKEMLEELVAEMEARYAVLTSLGVANINQARDRGRQFSSIVVFIEEMADLVLLDDTIETLIARLAQKSRAAGIHLVLATQRPDAETFSGLIRSNIPARVALLVQKSTESKIILDDTGAENLLGQGDMLIRLPGEGNPVRIHGAHIRPGDISAALARLPKA